MNTALVASLTNSSDISSLTAMRSMRFGHCQSKSPSALKSPSFAARMRRCRDRWVRSSSSHWISGATHSAPATSDQCLARPFRRNACARVSRMSLVFAFMVIMACRQLIIGIEPVRLHRRILAPYVLGQIHCYRRRCAPRGAPAAQPQTYAVCVRHVCRERLLDRSLQLGCSVPVEQARQAVREPTEICAALSRAREQQLAGRHGLRQAVDAAMLVRLAFAVLEFADVLGQFDLRVTVIAAGMTGNELGTVEHTHLLQVGAHAQRAPHMRVRYRVIVQVEAHVWGLADLDLDLFLDGIRVLWQGKQ